MDNLFLVRALTTAINAMRTPGGVILNRYFRPKAHAVLSSRFGFEVISGSEGVLKTIGVADPALVRDKTSRAFYPCEAPRIAPKKFISAAEVDSVRAFGSQISAELLESRIAKEQLDMRNEIERTLEFWAAHALRGQVLDSDLTTVLADYLFDADHTEVVGKPWNGDAEDPDIIGDIRRWKLMIEDDSGHTVTGWHAFCGYKVMNAIINDSSVRELLVFERGRQIAEQGAIVRLAGVTIEEYNGSFVTDSGTRTRFLDADEFILIGEGEDVFDMPYAPCVQEGASPSDFFFSKSWSEQDPSGRWILAEVRALPVVQRPNAIVRATVCT